MRAVASVPPPAPHGQIIVTGRVGQACARAGSSPIIEAAPAATLADSNSRLVSLVMGILLLSCRRVFARMYSFRQANHSACR